MDQHHHVDANTYFMDQLFAIGLGGAIGAICIVHYLKQSLFYLAPQFQLPVLLGGIVLLAFVAIRSWVLWRETGEARSAVVPCNHDHHHHQHDSSHQHDAGDSHHHENDCDAHHHHHEHHPHQHHPHHHHAGHDHGHDHGWNPWRYAVLALPVFLFLMNLPNKGLSNFAISKMGANVEGLDLDRDANFSAAIGVQLAKSGKWPIIGSVNSNTPAEKAGLKMGDAIVKIKLIQDAKGQPLKHPREIETKDLGLKEVLAHLRGEPGSKVVLIIQREGEPEPIEVTVTRNEVISLQFKDLERARFSALSRNFYTGRMGRLRGQFSPSGNDRVFSLMRLRMTCCGADVTPLNVVIIAPESLANLDLKAGDWVEVEGQIDFRLDQRKQVYQAVITVPSLDMIRKIPPEPDIFVRF
ncbi:MAG: hypothetical protein KatS3mg105_0039 [Gemmatales bacterium]|nr:MAG: hypothetical protein KatS3mg105_0039 [Gemmatales bacterium]